MNSPKRTNMNISNNYILIIIAVIFVYLRYEIYNLNTQVLTLKNEVKQAEVLNAPFYKQKSPPLLPSVRVSAEESKVKDRTIYGGAGDKAHLGGFTEKDMQGISPPLWDFMLSQLAVKSFVDIGCGRGFSSQYFLERGARVLCVEGSHDAVMKSVLPQGNINEHDFTRGPWWPEETFDVAWSVEFLEHVGRPYMANYFGIFHKSALIFVTSSIWGGWHHVEVHARWWWLGRMKAAGFVHLPELENVVHGQ